MPITQAPVTYKVLGQLQATAGWDLLYKVPDPSTLGSFARADAVCSTLTICNYSANTEEFSVAVLPGGGGYSGAVQNLIYNQVKIASNDTFAATFGITVTGDISVQDEIYVLASSTDVTFTLFGSEILTT
jgi:hypothetical protein